MLKACIAGALALVLTVSQRTTAPTTIPLGGYNENTRVDVTRIPVPLESQYRGDATAIVSFLDPSEIDRRCGTIPGMRVIACVEDIGGITMALPNPCGVEFQGEDYASVVCHEKGHILGWHHEYPSFTRMTREG